MEIGEKLRILSSAAKYDVSCSSSGSNRHSKKGSLGSADVSGICHSFTPDGRCVSLLKILLTNCCIYDCSYCINRKSNDIERAFFTCDEIVDLTMNFYRRNYIEGLFLSSSIVKNADFTMELLTTVAYKLRNEYNFRGYIHLKAIPGADKELIKKAGSLVDRMSVNIELPSAKSLKLLAPQKNKHDIFKPMGDIKNNIIVNKYDRRKYKNSPIFVPGGQSTQLIVGATKENDLNILNLTENLYNKFDLKRIYYSAYVPVNSSPNLPDIKTPPTLREHRLYQGDWLLRVYGFKAKELLNEKNPNFDINFDPKTTYALNNIHLFPVEINKAPYNILIRVPGIGIRGAHKIISARRIGLLDFFDLKKLGIVIKRAQYFITCKGRYYGAVKFDDMRIKKALSPKVDLNSIDKGKQLSFFDNMDNLTIPKFSSNNKLLLLNDKSTSITGEL
ncbi:putative DNA modification/repair radical SAM protein [Clostridium autoethanogenum]|uniref:Radical SAM superfamily protein n=2 Tax=Clostridium TaxID=1485 RepID=A0A1A6AVZ6_9CLOT|nr:MULTISPECIES: putative DNA modification/repair radical SAM protein [Clostridium]OBR94200.1 hypothetical protein CLRAG_15910 [Clostridium ragsdalei P11]RMD01038.1 putative DNA modification/repair radical SAM protein [Clostridium autoethanogenum]